MKKCKEWKKSKLQPDWFEVPKKFCGVCSHEMLRNETHKLFCTGKKPYPALCPLRFGSGSKEMCIAQVSHEMLGDCLMMDLDSDKLIRGMGKRVFNTMKTFEKESNNEVKTTLIKRDYGPSSVRYNFKIDYGNMEVTDGIEMEYYTVLKESLLMLYSADVDWGIDEILKFDQFLRSEKSKQV